MAFEDVQSSELTPEQMFDSVSNDGATEQTSSQPPEPAHAAAEAEPMFEYEALGATRKEPISLILKRAQMGYDYAQKQDGLKEREASVESRLAEANARFEKYAHLDDYAAQNPEWYDHWSNAYDQRAAGDTGQEQPAVDFSPVMNEINALRNEFGGVKEFVTQQQQSVEDGKYWDEVKGVQKEFPDIDLKQADESGKTLEYKILQHAKDNGIGSFRVAFRDFYFDNLKSRMAEQAKQDLITKDKAMRKQGIVGVSTTPMLSSKMPDLRNMNESDLLQAAIDEFNGLE